MKRFRSNRRTLKRGHLLVRFKEILLGWESSSVTGGMTPRFAQVPFLLRRTTRVRLVPYSG